MARIFIGQMEEEKITTKAEQLCKIANLAVLEIDGVASPEITKAADREPVVNIVKILYRAK